MTEIVDDKAVHVIPFILDSLKSFNESQGDAIHQRPFFIGLNGVQGAGKSVLVSILLNLLTKEPYNLSTVVFSLDDFYLTHKDQVALAESHQHNPLWQHRGQPGTHDIPLALEVFDALKKGQPTKIPQYNKAAFGGQGDRVPEAQWQSVNQDPVHKIKVVLFEGWCVGFRPLDDVTLRSKHESAVMAAKAENSTYSGRLGHNELQSVMDINDALKSYDKLTDQLDAFIHIDAADPLYVYDWRQEQERGLWKSKGSGMTNEQVKNFVDGYYPAYELYTETLRSDIFGPGGSAGPAEGRQIRLVVDRYRKVKDVIRL